MADEGNANDRKLTTQEALNRIKATVEAIEAGQGGDSADIAAIKDAVEAIKANSDLNTPDISALKAAVDALKANSDTTTPEVQQIRDTLNDVLNELVQIQANTAGDCDVDKLGYVRVEGSQLDPGDEMYITIPTWTDVLNGKITDVAVKVILSSVDDGEYYKVQSELQIIDPSDILRAVDEGLIIFTSDSGSGFGGSPMVNGQPGIILKVFEAPLRDTASAQKRPKVWIKNIGGTTAHITTIAQFNKGCVEVVT